MTATDTKPRPPLGRLIREGCAHLCPRCQSSMVRRFVIFGERRCIQPACGYPRGPFGQWPKQDVPSQPPKMYDEIAELHARILDIINRRVAVEQALLDVAAGKRALLTREECRELAAKLGVPSRYA